MLVANSMGYGEATRYLSRQRNLSGRRRVARAVFIATITPFTLKTADNPHGVDGSVLEKGFTQLAKDRGGQIAKAAPAFFASPPNEVADATVQW